MAMQTVNSLTPENFMVVFLTTMFWYGTMFIVLIMEPNKEPND